MPEQQQRTRRRDRAKLNAVTSAVGVSGVAGALVVALTLPGSGKGGSSTSTGTDSVSTGSDDSATTTVPATTTTTSAPQSTSDSAQATSGGS